MRHLLLPVCAAALLVARGAHGQSPPTGTTGTIEPPTAETDPQPGPRTRSTIIVRPAPQPRAPEPAPPVVRRSDRAPADLPPSANPGQCFARVALPQRLETYSARDLVTPQRTETRTVPALYADIDERVLVKPERREKVTIPATYRTVTETVVVRPGRTRVETIAPEYETLTEQVMVSPPRVEWRPEPPMPGARAPDPRPYRMSPTGEVWRLVEVPAVHRTVTRKVLARPARQAEFTDPPVTKQVTRRVVDRPAEVKERVTAAVYRTEKKRRLVMPERKETVVTPAEWRTVEKTRPAGPQVLEWREAPCAAAVTPDLVRRVQQALNGRGHPVGKADGVWGGRTGEALEAFQRAHGLPSGALTIETLRALDVQG